MKGYALLKVVTVVGTRPEIIRLSRIIAHLDTYFDHVLVHTGQNYDYELNQIFFEDLGIREPDFYLNVRGVSASDAIGQVIIKTDEVFQKLQPDAVLILGDTNSALCAISAKKRKIPIFHMEAGNRCFDSRVPEEFNRRIVDHASDINLPYSSVARNLLINEGLPPQNIITTGSPLFEVICHYKQKINDSDILSRMNLTDKKYFLLSCHREENVEDSLEFGKFIDVLKLLVEIYGLPVVVSTHPRTRKKLESILTKPLVGVEFSKPLSFTDYCKLQISAKLVLSDSGTITEEAAMLGFNALNLRRTHERHEGMEEAAVIMTGLDASKILSGIRILEHGNKVHADAVDLPVDYSKKNVSEKIVRIITSYVGYVNEYTWRR
jgi:UDP-N-acetylglucosamine 2-epimerase (non-hydrolysing)